MSDQELNQTGRSIMQYCDAVHRFLRHLDALDRSEETIRGYRMDLELFHRFIQQKYGGAPELEIIQADDIEEYLIGMKHAGHAPASRNRRLYCLRSFFKYCAKKQYCFENVAASVEIVRLPLKERAYLSRQEVKQIVRAIDHSVIKVVVEFLFYSGLRIKEALNLRISDVNINEGLIYVTSGKGAKDRTIPMSLRLRQVLNEYLETRRPPSESKYLFITRKTGRLSPQYVNFWIRKATNRLGWEGRITAHSFRHSFASALINKNVGIYHVQRLLGHADLRVTSRYCHANLNELRKAVNRI